MKRLILIAALVLVACEEPPAKPPPALDAHPVERYQMLPGPAGKVYVLDTADGWLRLCHANDSADSMFCGAAADQ